MTVNVNPPPQLRIPREILKNPEWLAYEQQRDVILFQLWNRTGGDNDNVANSLNIANQSTQAYSLWLQKQINGLPEFTMDTTGFTFDSTEITFDKVTA